MASGDFRKGRHLSQCEGTLTRPCIAKASRVLVLDLRAWRSMVRPFAAAILLLSLVLSAPWASACEKHINGHQNSSDTQGEAVEK